MKTQKELKALYIQELKTTSNWRDRPSMQDYISKKIDNVVELWDGYLYSIEKPHLEKDFCFWYSDDDNGRDFDRANEMSEYARTNEQYFIEKNLEDIERTIENYKEAYESERGFNDRWEQPFILTKARCWDLDSCKICETEWVHHWDIESEKDRLARFDSEIVPMNKQDIENMLDWLEIAKANFTKRLQTYLKKFWLSKLHTWTYWRDE